MNKIAWQRTNRIDQIEMQVLIKLHLTNKYTTHKVENS